MNIFSKDEILQQIAAFLKENPKGVLEILGPTASGKTELSIQIAKFLKRILKKNAEIICVDSRQIYREVNIASAKITTKEMGNIPHHGLDLVAPDEGFSVAEFQRYAFEKIDEILARDAVPILCGGTMLWLDAVSENYVFDKDPNVKLAPHSDPDVSGRGAAGSKKKSPPRYPFLKVGIHVDRKKLYERIDVRAKKMFAHGLVEETQEILKKYKLSRPAATSFGYHEIADYLNDKIGRTQALEQNKKRNRNYAKRQLTWWRGRKDILWINRENL